MCTNGLDGRLGVADEILVAHRQHLLRVAPLGGEPGSDTARPPGRGRVRVVGAERQLRDREGDVPGVPDEHHNPRVRPDRQQLVDGMEVRGRLVAEALLALARA